MKAFGDAFPSDRAHINVTSYNQRVLLTGEVTSEQGKAEAQAIAEKSKDVRAVVNELHIGSPSTLSNRNFDTSLTTKVRTALLQAPDVPSGAIKVVSERAVVYLMGLVTPGEARPRRASPAASRRAAGGQELRLPEREGSRQGCAGQVTPAGRRRTRAGRRRRHGRKAVALRGFLL